MNLCTSSRHVDIAYDKCGDCPLCEALDDAQRWESKHDELAGKWADHECPEPEGGTS